MTTDPRALARLAACYSGIPSGNMQAVMISVLARWLQSKTGYACGTPSYTVLISGATPVNVNQKYEYNGSTSGGFFIWEGVDNVEYRLQTNTTSCGIWFDSDGNGNWVLVYSCSVANFPCGPWTGEGTTATGQYTNLCGEATNTIALSGSTDAGTNTTYTKISDILWTATNGYSLTYDGAQWYVNGPSSPQLFTITKYFFPCYWLPYLSGDDSPTGQYV